MATADDRAVVHDDFIPAAVDEASRRIAVVPWVLMLITCAAIEAATFTTLLYFQKGVDVDGNQVMPLAALALPGTMTCAGFLLTGLWLKQGHKLLAYGLLGVLFFVACAVSAGLSMQYLGAGLGALIGDGFTATLGGAQLADMLAVLIGGCLAMVPGLLVLLSERGLMQALARRATQRETARRVGHYHAAQALAGEYEQARESAAWLSCGSLPQLAAQDAHTIAQQVKDQRATQHQQLLLTANDRGQSKRARRAAATEYNTRKEPTL